MPRVGQSDDPGADGLVGALPAALALLVVALVVFAAVRLLQPREAP